MARFDPRGRVNHALIVTVPEYNSPSPPDPSGVLGDIAAVRHNATELSRVLGAGGVFGPEDVTTCSPPGSDAFFRDLMRARERADGLLLLYFAGHGLVSSYNEPDELWLAMPGTTIVPGSPPAFLQAVRWSDVLPALCQAGAEQVVVILDCCYAGNASAAWNKLPPADRRRVSLLACVQANDRIDAGDGARATPFTASLVRLLEGGVDGRGGEVGFAALTDALTTHMSREHTTLRARRTPWVPQSCPATGADVVLAVAGVAGQTVPHTTALPVGGQEPGGPEPVAQEPVVPKPVAQEPVARKSRARPAAWAAVALVLAVLLGYAGIRALQGDGDQTSCTPPLELRLLTDADAEPTVRKAVDTYLGSPDNRDRGCRRSGITVYSARAADAVAAFRNTSGFWQDPNSEANPQRDVGPQPDIWIPGSAASVDRARADDGGGSSVRLKAYEPFAHSPMVLAVPAGLAEATEDRRAGRPLAQFVQALRERASGATVARTDPEYTDSGLLATMGLYGERPGAAAGVERSLLPGRPWPDGRALLCHLPEQDAVDTKTAALVPEHLLKTGVGCERQTRAPRVAEYPADVPLLTLPFVHVTWDGAERDKEPRNDAVERLRAWLTGADGLAVFTADGYRAGPGDAPPAEGASPPAAGALADPGPLAEPADADTMAEALDGYRRANGPGRVLFLLDSSGSMKDVWDGPGGAPGIIEQSLDGLGGQDAYGAWAVASAPGATRPYTELLALGTHPRRAEAGAAIRRARVVDHEADPYNALRAALTAVGSRAEGDDSPRLIVFVTDDEDNNRLTSGDRLEGLLTSLRQGGVPVVMASLDVGGCAKGRADERIAEASGGRCLDSAADLVAGLRNEVARTGTGEGS
ncbi:VWA domain-containing protein [Streptomyces sp. NPDC000410]|uniref:VWA domain-containing protein n=1 Tax=Streptomyces sp. NPDC000410 TaxID=3154254 RepID=UPI0033271DF9